MGTLPFLQKETTSVTSCLFPGMKKPLQYGVLSEGANPFLVELTPNEENGQEKELVVDPFALTGTWSIYSQKKFRF